MDANHIEPTAAAPVLKGGLSTKAQLAALLQLTPRTIENLQRRGLPFYRLGSRRNRYDPVAVREWLDRSCKITRVKEGALR